MSLRGRVVRILATLAPGGQPQQGFGFIVGENGDQLVVVTADHVVRGDSPGSEDKTPSVTFFSNQGSSVKGFLQSTSLPRGQGDLAVILVPRPRSLALAQASFSSAPPVRGEAVWVIGRAGQWDVPVIPGRISDVEFNGTIKVEGLGARLGSSGGPLVSADGIVGMIVTDGELSSEAEPIGPIQRQVHDQWQYAWQAPASPGPRPPSRQQSGGGTIMIWKVGSPYTGAVPDASVPPNLERDAEAEGAKLTVRAMSARDFVDRVRDAGGGTELPDIVAIDNYGLIQGITTALGTYPPLPEAIRSRLSMVTESLMEIEGPQPARMRGWEFLITGSPGYSAARKLALSNLACDPAWHTSILTGELFRLAPATAALFMRGATRELAALDSRNRMETESSRRAKVQVAGFTRCGYWGNGNLAFVPLKLSYEQNSSDEQNASSERKNMLGERTMLLIFDREDGRWKLLCASMDPVSVMQFLSAMPRLVGLLAGHSMKASVLTPARLIAPEEGAAPRPEPGQRFGDFIWQPSPSPDVVAEVAEFGYQGDARLFWRFPSPGQGARAAISAGSLWTTKSTWRWRVWSISRSGEIAFSKVRSFPN